MNYFANLKNSKTNMTQLFISLVCLLFSLCASELYAQDVPVSFAELAKKYGPTVVNIYSTQTIQARNLPYDYFFDNEQIPDLFRHFFDIPQQPPPGNRQLPSEKRTSLGSGVIISDDGYIITNNHVIENADEINVRLANYEEYKAKIIGKDNKTDLALIKIEPKHTLDYAEFGNSEELQVGDWVIAIGNPFGFDHTVTAGIVSGKGRTLGADTYQNFIQTDASINPGNSGGPLFNMKGELMGINTAIYSRSGGNIGLGFAIPANMTKNVISQLQGTGKVTRGMLGVMIQPVTADLAEQFNLERPVGALVGQVLADSPADKAGIKSGDIITEFNGKEIVQMTMLPALVAQTTVGTKAEVTLFRNGKKQRLTVIIGELAEEKDSASSNDDTIYSSDNLGLSVQEVTSGLAESLGLESEDGLIVSNINPGSLAEQSGLQRGDILLEGGVGQKRMPLVTVKDFENLLAESGQHNILLLVKSGKQTRFVLLKKK
jgi:serine protease Do